MAEILRWRRTARVAVGTGVCAALLAAPYAQAHKKAAPPPPPVRATLKPSATIPAEPLGFAAPGDFYLGARNSLVSLDFLDENRLLFTFRVPGLIRREPSGTDDERRIRAVVLDLPQGNVEAEGLWTVHDKGRYLQILHDGHFLFRDGNNLYEGDATLQLKPLLRFPGPLLWVDTDPTDSYLVTGSREPVNRKPKSGEVGSPATAAASVTTDDDPPPSDPDLVLRILRRDSGQVMLVSRIHNAIQLPINTEGYLESIRGQGMDWKINLNRFDGGETELGQVKSVCTPTLNFLSPREILAGTCSSLGDASLVAMTTRGRMLWKNESVNSVWPLLKTSANGLRVARETLVVDHSVNTVAPLGTDDIKGQDVQVLDAATGKQVLRAAASPVFDVGGNVALSPSGKRVAVIMDEKIQLFDLPAPAPLPELTNRKSTERAERR